MEVALYALYAIVAGLALYALTAFKTPKTKPPAFDENSVPVAQEGLEYPVLYGTDWFTDQNVVWFGDGGVETETEDHVRTFRYYLGMHMEFCQGPPDKLLELRADDRAYWIGEVTESDQIEVNAPELFGGKRSGGGIAGLIDVLFGEETQGVNDYLEGVLPGPLPGMRGVAGLVFRKAYVTANSPYVRPHAARWKRIFNGWADENGLQDSTSASCWYPETAEISTEAPFIEEFDEGLDPYTQTSGPPNAFEIAETEYGDALFAHNSLPFDDEGTIVRSITPAAYTTITARFKIVQYGFFHNDSPILTIKFTDENFISFTPQRDASVSSSEQPTVLFPLMPDEDGVAVGPALALGVWYSIYIQLLPAAQSMNVILTEYPSGASVGTALGIPVPWLDGSSVIDRLRFDGSVDASEEPGSCYYDSIVFGLPGGDMNPAHVMYDIITNQFRGMGRPIADIDDESFRAGATTHFVEMFGISTKFNRQGPVADFMKAIEEVADSVCDIDPITGDWYYAPNRADYDPDTLPEFDESNILEINDFTAHAYGNIVTRVVTKYKHPTEPNTPAETRWDNPATYGAQYGRMTISEFLAPQIRNHALAGRVCAREGRKQTHELRAFTAIVNRDGYGLRRGKVVKMTWGKLGMAGVICRVIGVNYGNLENRQIKLALVEDIYGLPDSSYTAVQSSQWTPMDTAAYPATARYFSEAPYYALIRMLSAGFTEALDADAGYLMGFVGRPTALSLGYNIWTSPDFVDEDFIETASGKSFVATATIVDTVGLYDDPIAIENGVGTATMTLPLFMVFAGGSDEEEICEVTDLELDNTSIRVSRAILDTTPKAHVAGTRVFFINPVNGWALNNDPSYEDDVVSAAPQTYASGGVLSYAETIALHQEVTIERRQNSPYPPGAVFIDSGIEEEEPTLVVGPFDVLWSHRHRLQRTLTIVEQLDTNDYGPEDGVTYNVRAYLDDVLVDSDTGITGTTWTPSIGGSGTVRIEIEAERDGVVSWQAQIRTFDFLIDDAWLDAGGDYLLDAGGDIVI